jgi:hypothetical protein
MKSFKRLQHPIVIESLEWEGWINGWTIHWRTLHPVRGVPDGCTHIGYFTLWSVFKRIAWWLEPAPASALVAPRKDKET